MNEKTKSYSIWNVFLELLAAGADAQYNKSSNASIDVTYYEDSSESGGVGAYEEYRS